MRLADKQLVRVLEEQQPIVGFYRIGWVMAHVMFDSGLGTNMISADFICAAGLRLMKLDQPVGLQLALKGSRGQLNYGINAPVEIGIRAQETYFNVTGIDKYDAILGTLFLRKARAKLDFEVPLMIIDGV